MASNESGAGGVMTRIEELTDPELLALAAGGDEAAFEVLYHRNRPRVYRYALHMTGAKTVAEDITQEVFLTLIGKLSAFNPKQGTVPGYLLGITRKLVLRHFECGAATLPLAAEHASGAPAIPELLIERQDPFTRLTQSERIELVRRAIRCLPARYREAVVLCDLEEMGYEQAAAAANCPIGTLRSRLHRARMLLASKLRLPQTAAATPSPLKSKRCLA